MLEILAILGEGALLLNITAILFLNKKRAPHFVLLVFLIFVFVIQIYSHWLRDHGRNNLFLSHFLFPGQSILLTKFCYLLIVSKTLKRILLIVTMLLWIVTFAVAIQPSNGSYVFNQMEILISSVTIITALLTFIYDSLGTETPFRLSAVGLLVYFIASAAIFICGNLLVKLSPLTHGIWLLHLVLFLLMQLTLMADNIKNMRKQNTWEGLKLKFFRQ